MAKYKVQATLDYDNKRIEPGKVVELDDDTAQPLLAVGVVEAVSLKKVDAEDSAKNGGGK